jgi:hypothetical protein
MDAVGEIMVFYCGKEGRRLKVGSPARWNGGATCRKKRILFEVVFISFLTWK